MLETDLQGLLNLFSQFWLTVSLGSPLVIFFMLLLRWDFKPLIASRRVVYSVIVVLLFATVCYLSLVVYPLITEDPYLLFRAVLFRVLSTAANFIAVLTLLEDLRTNDTLPKKPALLSKIQRFKVTRK